MGALLGVYAVLVVELCVILLIFLFRLIVAPEPHDVRWYVFHGKK